jgi:hypothetical protein
MIYRGPALSPLYPVSNLSLFISLLCRSSLLMGEGRGEGVGVREEPNQSHGEKAWSYIYHSILSGTVFPLLIYVYCYTLVLKTNT